MRCNLCIVAILIFNLLLNSSGPLGPLTRQVGIVQRQSDTAGQWAEGWAIVSRVWGGGALCVHKCECVCVRMCMSVKEKYRNGWDICWLYCVHTCSSTFVFFVFLKEPSNLPKAPSTSITIFQTHTRTFIHSDNQLKKSSGYAVQLA